MSFVVAFETAIVTTGTAQELPSNPVIHSVTIQAPSTNTANVTIGNNPGVTATTGYSLPKGTSVSIPIRGGNTNSLYIVGTAADVVQVLGA